MIGGIQNSTDISTDMMAQMRQQMFAKLDNDGDGQIDLSQLQAQSEEMSVNDPHFADLVESLTAADTDGDGMVSEAEFEAMEPPGPPPPPPGDEMSGQMDMSQLLDSLYSEDGSENESIYQIGTQLNLLCY